MGDSLGGVVVLCLAILTSFFSLESQNSVSRSHNGMSRMSVFVQGYFCLV